MSEQEEFEFRLRLEREQAQGQPRDPVVPEQDPLADLEPAAPPERDFLTERLPRQIGLTARAGIEGATAPINVLGDVAGLRSSEAVSNFLTMLGLPEPESKTERIANVVAGGMAGAGGISRAAGALAKAAAPAGATSRVAAQVAEAPGITVASGGAAAGAGEATKEAGGGPLTQFLASMVAAGITPTGAGLVRYLKGIGGDTWNALRASFGNEKAIERIAGDAIQEVTKSNPQVIAGALERAETGMPSVKMSVGQAVAKRNVEVPSEQVGGAVIALQKRLKGAKTTEDTIPTFEAEQGQAVRDYVRRLNERTDPLREEALAKAAPINPTYPLLRLHQVLRTPEGKSEVGTRTLNKLRNRIANMAKDSPGGRIDPADLYVVRKEINNTIAGFVKPGTKWDKKTTARLESEIRDAIDDAIESAGGTGWKSYLRTYSEGMKPLDKLATLNKKMAEIGRTVEPRSVAQLAQAEVPTIPTLLHRPTMLVNFALKHIVQDVTDPVTKKLAKLMTDPEKFLELMRRPAGTPARQTVDEVLARSAILAGLIDQHQQDLQQGE